MAAARQISRYFAAEGMLNLLSVRLRGHGSQLALTALLRQSAFVPSWSLWEEGNAVGNHLTSAQGWSNLIAHSDLGLRSEVGDGSPSCQWRSQALLNSHPTLQPLAAQQCQNGSNLQSAPPVSCGLEHEQTASLLLLSRRTCIPSGPAFEHGSAVRCFSAGVVVQGLQRSPSLYTCPEAQISSGSPLRSPTTSPSVPAFVPVRCFASDVRAKPRAAQARSVRLAPQSLNTVVEPFKKPPPMPLWRRWLTLEGWRLRKDSVMSALKTGYAIAKVKRAISGYSLPLFFGDVTRLYCAVNRALAAGDVAALRGLVTERTLGQMKQELEARRRGGWATLAWDLPNPAAIKCRTVHGRLVGVDPKNTTLAFAQITVRLQSRQKFVAYDRKGQLLAGSPDQELLVEDHWVFERPLWMKDATWRLCGRLTL